MLSVAVDQSVVALCREHARVIAREVQGFIDRHTTTGVERTLLRALGVTGTDDRGAPLVNRLVERLHQAGLLEHGAATFLAATMQRHATSLQHAAERLAYGAELPAAADRPPREVCEQLLRRDAWAALERVDRAREERDARRARLGVPPGPSKYVIVATGNIHDDATQARAAAQSGADVVAVIRATAQSLLDYVPFGATTEGYGGTFATQENFRIIRAALDEVSEELGRYVMATNYSSGLCMSEIAWMAAVERIDMLLNDSMYGILFRDINMQRTFVDQYFSRLIIRRSGIVINTGEDNYLTTADALEAAHTVLASQLINEAFAHEAGVPDALLGLGHAFEIDPAVEDSFSIELAQALLVRQIFAAHPIKWMPPTKHKTGDVFQSHVQDTLFSLVGILTGQSIELLGMFSEAVHNPLMMDRHLSLKATSYVFRAARHLREELSVRPDGRLAARAAQVLGDAEALLARVREEGMFAAIARGAFADIKRAPDGGKGLSGVVARSPDYLNPLLAALEVS